jgi:hypothetical protein
MTDPIEDALETMPDFDRNEAAFKAWLRALYHEARLAGTIATLSDAERRTIQEALDLLIAHDASANEIIATALGLREQLRAMTISRGRI